MSFASVMTLATRMRGHIAVNQGEDVHWGSGGAGWGTPDLGDLPRRPLMVTDVTEELV